MEWPSYNPETGRPITTPTNQAIFLAAVKPAALQVPELVRKFEDRMKQCANWRSDYSSIIEEFVRIQASCSPETTLAMCRSGLHEATRLFRFRPESAQETVDIQSAFFGSSPGLLETATYRGAQNTDAASQKFELGSPRGTPAEPVSISGEEAVSQLRFWEDYGCIEPSAAARAKSVCERDELSSLVSDKTFVLLGVTSEMGPARSLLKIPGSHIMGVARSGEKMQGLINFLKENGTVDTTLQVPEGGADILRQGPEIAQWIVRNAPKHRRIVLMPLAYMDGEMNVKVTVAMDQVVQYVQKHSPDMALSYLTSPATVYAIPRESALDAKCRFDEKSAWESMISVFSIGRVLEPSRCWETSDDSLVIYNGIVSLQGPNYLLAKTMQQWRCMVARDDGIFVAAPHAPATRTISVTHSAKAAAALEGWQYIEPMVTFDVYPCSTLVTAIVLDQLCCGGVRVEGHPLEMFFDGSVHGGLWRCPYKPDSMGSLAFFLGKLALTLGWTPPKQWPVFPKVGPHEDRSEHV